MTMKIGNMIRHKLSEGGLLGIIIGYHQPTSTKPPTYLVKWSDGRLNWVVERLMEPVYEAR